VIKKGSLTIAEEMDINMGDANFFGSLKQGKKMTDMGVDASIGNL